MGCIRVRSLPALNPIVLRRLSPGCALMGRLDKRAIASGRHGVDSELARLQPLPHEGKYIPFLDHHVPPDVPCDTYLYVH